MYALAFLLLSTAAAAGPLTDRGSARENPLVAPARCVLRYLEAVRKAGPHLPANAKPGMSLPVREQDYARAKELTAPRTLADIQQYSALGRDHPLAPWRDVARSRVLEAFRVVAIRSAPRGTVVVTVAEHWWQPGRTRLVETASEYLVARVGGDWKVVDRRPGAAFENAVIETRYAGYFDEPQPSVK